MKKSMLVVVFILLVSGSVQAGWTSRKLVGSYPSWDYWWLNARLAIDRFDTLYCAVSRYNYSNSDPEHDLYVLNTDGDTVRTRRPWHGYEYQPIVQDATGRNIYIGQPLIGMYLNGLYHMDSGVTDDSNCVSTTNSSGNDSIYFTRLGPSGERLVWRQFIYRGDPWTGRTGLARDPRGWLHMVSEDTLQRVLYGFSTDRGQNWTWDTLSDIRVTSHVRIVATPDTCIHIIFRTWTSDVQLRYMKLRAHGSVAVAPSVFARGSERWEPNMVADTDGNLRVVYVDGTSFANSLFYTVLRGDLDAGGQSVPDSELTLVPDTVIQTDPVRLAGPKICVDLSNRAHVLFEQGVYGQGGSKYVYHIREEGQQGVSEEPVNARTRRALEVSPNPMRARSLVTFLLERPGQVRIWLCDVTGRKVGGLFCGSLPAGEHALGFDRAGLAAGTYYLMLDAGGGRQRLKVVVAGSP